MHTFSNEKYIYSVDLLIKFLNDAKMKKYYNIKKSRIPISKLIHNLNFNCWANDSESSNFSPNVVLDNPNRYKGHYSRIIQSNLKYPIVISNELFNFKKDVCLKANVNNFCQCKGDNMIKPYVVDGVHRLTKAKLLAKKYISVYNLNEHILKLFRIRNKITNKKILDINNSNYNKNILNKVYNNHFYGHPKMSSNAFINNITNLKNKPNVIIIVGMGGVGKSTLSNKIKSKLDYSIINMDLIIKELAKKHKNGMRITGLYNPNRYEKEKQIVIDKVLNIMNDSNNKYVIEGTIWDPKIIKAFIKNKSYSIVYKQPKSIETYKKYIMERVKSDIKNNTKSMSIVWKSLTIQQINNISILNKFINQIAYYRLSLLQDDYKIFDRFGFTIIQ